MTKKCPDCGEMFEAKTNARRCVKCRPNYYRLRKQLASLNEDREVKNERLRRYRETHKEERREYERIHRNTPKRKTGIQRKRDLDRFGGLRNAVLERDGYKCQVCGTVQIEGKRNLIVHHRDFDPTHNELGNLITLCRKCHPRQHFPTPESNAKRAASLRGKKRGPGKPLTPEHKLKIGMKSKGRKHSDAAKEKMTQLKREWWSQRTEEQRQQISENLRAGQRRRKTPTL